MNRVAGVMGIALISAWAMLAACVGSDPDPTVSSRADGSATNDGASSATPLTGNVLQRGGFEDPGCLGWTNNQATLDQDPAAQGGNTSCRVCSAGATSVWGVFQNTTSVPKGAYTVTAYARASGDAGVPQHVTFRAVSLDKDGQETTNLQERTVDIGVNDPTWQKASFDFAVEQDNEPLSFGALINDTLDGCFLIDEFTVTPKK